MRLESVLRRLQSWGKGGNVTTDILLKVCEALHCHVEDIIETKDD